MGSLLSVVPFSSAILLILMESRGYECIKPLLFRPAIWSYPNDFDVETNISKCVPVSVDYMDILSETSLTQFMYE